MRLGLKLALATGIAAPLNAAFWSLTQRDPVDLADSVVPALIWFGTFLRIPFDLAFFIAAAIPLSLRFGGSLPRYQRYLMLLGAGLGFGMLLFVLINGFGVAAMMNPFWLMLSYLLSATVWFAFDAFFPGEYQAPLGYRAALSAGLDTMRQAATASGRAVPWLLLGWLLPFIVLAVVALFFVALS